MFPFVYRAYAAVRCCPRWMLLLLNGRTRRSLESCWTTGKENSAVKLSFYRIFTIVVSNTLQFFVFLSPFFVGVYVSAIVA